MSASTSSAPWQPGPAPGADRTTFHLGRERSDFQGGIDWDLKRNCSLAPRQLLGFYLSLCAVSLGIASAFWLQGAPWVMPFAWVEVLAVGAALWVYARHAGDRESIALSSDRLTVVHANGSQVVRVEFLPAWVRVEPEHGDHSLVELSGQGRRISVGRFVRPEQRRQLADELRWALRRWHRGALPMAAM
jgi:uncharacterized membrane protein